MLRPVWYSRNSRGVGFYAVMWDPCGERDVLHLDVVLFFARGLSMEFGKLVGKDTHYSLPSIKHVAHIDVPRYILISRYIYICDMFYGTGKVFWIGRRKKTE
jgi:hypothetical protein